MLIQNGLSKKHNRIFQIKRVGRSNSACPTNLDALRLEHKKERILKVQNKYDNKIIEAEVALKKHKTNRFNCLQNIEVIKSSKSYFTHWGKMLTIFGLALTIMCAILLILLFRAGELSGMLMPVLPLFLMSIGIAYAGIKRFPRIVKAEKEQLKSHQEDAKVLAIIIKDLTQKREYLIKERAKALKKIESIFAD